MSIVLDCSATLAWFLEDEQTAATGELLQRVAGSSAVVPSLWRLEIANGLRTALRRGRITAEYRDAALADPGALDRTVDAETDRHAWSATVRLANGFRLATYDAAYLELAQRRNLPLGGVSV